MKTLEILKNRRILASIFGALAFALAATGTTVDFDVVGATDAALKLVEAISALAAIILPVISYFFPKSA